MQYLTKAESVLLGESKAVAMLRDHIRKAAAVSAPVLICGPAGVGKEVTARAIHAASGRLGPFMPINASQVSEFVSRNAMLYRSDRTDTECSTYPIIPGDSQDSKGGTLFLKEICQLQRSGQTVLLHALNGQLFQPNGDNEEMDANQPSFRLISATNVSPKHLLKGGRFRENLLRRLSGVTIEVPSLVQRCKDIPVLALYFLSVLPEPDRPLGCTAAAMRRLQAYHWPGNIRELQRVITAAATLAPGAMLDEMAITFALDTVDRGHRVQPVLADSPPFTGGPSYDEASGQAASPAPTPSRVSQMPPHLARRTVSYWLGQGELPDRGTPVGTGQTRARH